MPEKPHRIRGTTPAVEQAARRLRWQATPAEAELWKALQRKQLSGLKFRRQHPVGRFIVDFYCASKKLVVEVDGDIHDHQQEYDQARTEQLKSHGYQVLRFTNTEVLTDLKYVLSHISKTAEIQSPPNLGG